jgi:hypothetical protein
MSNGRGSMKIAVLTYNIGKNYGGILQSYAMLQTLKKLGHKPELLYIESKFHHNWKTFLIIYLLSRFANKWDDLKFAVKNEDEIYKNLFCFIDKYINTKTKPLKSYKDFVNVTQNNYDAYLVGSDQVWRAKIFKYIDYSFFGFVKDDNPILLSYAASFGVDRWEYNEYEKQKYKKQIQRFSGISIREESGVELCKKYFEKEAVHVLDPSMLLSVDDYRSLIENENEPKHNGGLLIYILDDTNEKLELINIISKKLSIKPFKINAKSQNNNNIEDMIYPTVTSWLKGFDDAEYVITDSFHGCVFSIIFNIPFIVYGNEKRGMSRFESLLKMFNLEDRLVLSKSEVNVEKIKCSIEWGDVNLKLVELKEMSMSFLTNNLK